MEIKEHGNYKGNNAGYMAKHLWISKKYGKLRICQLCGTREAKYYDWANVSGKYKREISDWLRLCRNCHKQFDRKDKCKYGHIFSNNFCQEKECLDNKKRIELLSKITELEAIIKITKPRKKYVK